jgi:hypothetical protein
VPEEDYLGGFILRERPPQSEEEAEEALED